MQALVHGLDFAELTAALQTWGEPRFRATQLWEWLYVRRAAQWEAMTNLPAALRVRLADAFRLESAALVETLGVPGETRKLLAALPDGDRVESVLIPAPGRRTVCVSSQVGCQFACVFCASGQAGFRRNLEAGEIVGQALLAAQVYGERPTHVVFMGIGEPFDNYGAVLHAVRILNDTRGVAIGARRITLSTAGVIPGIQRLAGEGLQVELSVSLHAPDNDLRSRLMPVNRLYPLPDLLAACRAYGEETRRLITFEYTLIKGVNDAPEQARALAQALKPLLCRVNVIPLSPVAEYAGHPSTAAATDAFAQILLKAGINCTVRISKGTALKGACGQLRFGRPETPL